MGSGFLGIALNAQRYDRLYDRIQHISIFLPTALFLVSVLLLDFFTEWIETLLVDMYQLFFLLSSLTIITMLLIMIILSAKQPHKTLQNLTLLFMTIGITFVGIEMLFRFVLVEHRVPRTDQEFEARVASSWPRPIALEKAPQTFRIVGLADSFGRAGEENNYHYLLEERLQIEDLNLEVLNFSVSAYELPEESELLTRFGARYQPNMVLHGIFIGNDFWGNPEITLVSYRGISLQLKKGLGSWRPHNFLLRQWISNSLTVFWNEHKKKQEQTPAETAGVMAHSEFLRVERKRLTICDTAIRSDDQFWLTAVRMLDQIHQETRRMGAEYVIVIHPDQFQVEHQLLQEIGESYNLDPSNYDLEQPQRFLLNYCQDRGIACLDLLPIFRRNGSDGGLYLVDDTHYNALGNQLAADEIFHFLKSNNILPHPSISPAVPQDPTPLPTLKPEPIFRINRVLLKDAGGNVIHPVDEIYTVNVGEPITIVVELESPIDHTIKVTWTARNGKVLPVSGTRNTYTAQHPGADYIIIQVRDEDTGDALEEPITIMTIP